MNLNKKLSPWQKLRIKYEYNWMDREFHFNQIIATPTWFMTHNAKQIERRIASYNAMMEKYRKEKEELIRRLKEIERQLREENERRNAEKS